MQELKDAAASATSKENSRKSSGNENEAKILGLFSDSHHYIKLYENLKSVFMVQRNTLDRNDKVKKTCNSIFRNSYVRLSRKSILVFLSKTESKSIYLACYDEIKQKVITQANDYHWVKAYTQ